MSGLAAFLRPRIAMKLTSVARLVVLVLLPAACASTPHGREQQPQRVPDSVPDKIAAQRAAAGLHLEEEDERWGIEAARARKQNQENHPAPAAPAPAAGPARSAPGP